MVTKKFQNLSQSFQKWLHTWKFPASQTPHRLTWLWRQKNWGFKRDDDSEQRTRRCPRIPPSTRSPRVSWGCRLQGLVSGFERGGREISHGPSFASFQLNFGDVGICSFGAFCGLQGFWVYSHRFLKVKFERVFDVCIEDLVVGLLTRVKYFTCFQALNSRQKVRKKNKQRSS